MKTIDIILIVALSLWVVFSIAYVVVNRKKGKTSCGSKTYCNGDCEACNKKKKEKSNEFSRFPRIFRGNFLFLTGFLHLFSKINE